MAQASLSTYGQAPPRRPAWNDLIIFFHNGVMYSVNKVASGAWVCTLCKSTTCEHCPKEAQA